MQSKGGEDSESEASEPDELDEDVLDKDQSSNTAESTQDRTTSLDGKTKSKIHNKV